MKRASGVSRKTVIAYALRASYHLSNLVAVAALSRSVTAEELRVIRELHYIGRAVVGRMRPKTPNRKRNGPKQRT